MLSKRFQTYFEKSSLSKLILLLEPIQSTWHLQMNLPNFLKKLILWYLLNVDGIVGRVYLINSHSSRPAGMKNQQLSSF